jgi:hypothetical protein
LEFCFVETDLGQKRNPGSAWRYGFREQRKGWNVSFEFYSSSELFLELMKSAKSWMSIRLKSKRRK